ncbi:MAG: beta-lactamase [Nitrososphaeraceae archaeon]|nr:beta-lactamase [Nitrososphaeraceae archaeon]MCD6036829.1 beta-lactamase [Nitrososphaeraceae archaeon]MDF2767764.1 beta-lactamase [Nitrososphaeraceae archaeon]
MSIYGILYILTPYSGFARSIIWQDSDINDYERFPFRIIDNAQPVFRFITQDINSTTEESKINGSFLSSPVLFNKIVPNGDTEGKKKSFDEFLASTGTTAFIVIKNDEILYEKYFNGYHEESINTSFSMAKSITSALIGIAIDEGMIQSVDDPIAKYLPELRQKDPSFNSITLKNLLTMSSGLRYIEEGLPWSDDSRTYYDTDLRSLALSAKVEEQPGKRFHYNNYNALLLGMILERTTHMNVSQYLEEKIWKPLGMEASASWSLDSDAHGFEKMESGINARAIDFAKIGRLFLNNGNWNGKQIISEIWVNESTRPDTITDPTQFYQYMWWVENAQKEGNYHFFAVGKYGQYIYVIPEKNMIIVRHGYESGYDGWTDLFKNIARIV